MKFLNKLKSDRKDLINNLNENIVSLEKIAYEQQAEIERLKAEANCADGYADALVERTKTEAIKEFAERLKEKAWIGMWESVEHVDVDDIDNLVKEMVGDDNNSPLVDNQN